jgi:predicted Zn finger-like uncharacterized protein
MSLVTTCPACATAFRVVPDQLKVAEGWVRCGECGEVFDARSTLEDTQAGADAPAAHAASTTEPDPPLLPGTGPTPGPAGTESDFLQPEPEPEREPEPEPEPEPEIEPAPLPEAVPVPVPVPEPERDLQQEPNPAPEPALVRDEVDFELAAARHRTPDLLLDEPLLRLPSEPSDDPVPVQGVAKAGWPSASGIDGESNAPALAPEDLGFMREARRGSAWRTPAVRALLGTAAAVLLVLLAGQFALHHRHALAALHPPLAPALRLLCAPLACEVDVPQAIESIVIDSSGFVRIRGDVYRLGVTLRNQAPTPVQVPALELTLTDADDRPLLRRILRPQELGELPGAIPAGGDLTAAATLAIEANGIAARITGYRLLAFYP